MKVDELRIIGSTQTNVVMAAELIRIAQRAVKKRPPEPRKEGLGQLVYPFDADLAWAAVTYMRTVLYGVELAEPLAPLLSSVSNTCVTSVGCQFMAGTSTPCTCSATLATR